jgi:putative ABC transport system ATP-binding protein
MSDAPIIETRAVEKSFDTGGAIARVLRGVDLAVQPGEFIAIMGPSGCGKSTLLHLLGGLDRPTAGEIYLDGRRVDGLNEKQWAVIRRQQVGYMFQSFNLIANMTAAENIELPALVAGVSSGEARRRRNGLLELLGIADKASLVPGEMSGGQQQRVALARAMVNEPAMLLADEPTGNLDSASAREVLAMLRERHARGQTLVLVTHDATVASAADRIVRMIDGRIEPDAVPASMARDGVRTVAMEERT